MTMISHIAMLEEKHSKLESLITSESHRPLPDFDVIRTLKKQKLILKEELTRLSLKPERFDAA